VDGHKIESNGITVSNFERVEINVIIIVNIKILPVVLHELEFGLSL
jgi:hypothetical protein